HDSMPRSRYVSVRTARTSAVEASGSSAFRTRKALRAVRACLKSSRSRRVTVSPSGWRVSPSPFGGQMQSIVAMSGRGVGRLRLGPLGGRLVLGLRLVAARGRGGHEEGRGVAQLGLGQGRDRGRLEDGVADV